MNDANAVAAGLAVLLRYDSDRMLADRGVVYAGLDCREVSGDDAATLERLGWAWDAEVSAWAYQVGR